MPIKNSLNSLSIDKTIPCFIVISSKIKYHVGMPSYIAGASCFKNK